PHPVLHSFPTRRSSDLLDRRGRPAGGCRGGINFCRTDAGVMAQLPHIVASFFARHPYKLKAGHYPNWNGFYLLLYPDVEEGWKLDRKSTRLNSSHVSIS